MEPVDPSSLSTLEAARTFVPGWWLRAFEMSATSPRDGSLFDLSPGSILPRFDSQELGLLSYLLGDIQKQLLASDVPGSEVVLDWCASQKHLSGSDVATRERLSRVFESIPQIRFLVRMPTGAINAIPLFIAEHWETDSGNPEARRVRLRPQSFAVELLTGYIDGHLDFLRSLTGGGRLGGTECGRAPLVLWTPVWLELSVPEQLVYSRMEQAMQCQGSWLRLDGLVGAPLDKITAGIKIQKKPAENSSLLKERLRLIGKLGRRLSAHGVIQKDPDSGYMALNSGELTGSPALLWQATAERLRSKAEFEFFGLTSSRILRGIGDVDMGRLFVVLAAISGAGTALIPSLRRIWSEIKDIPGCGLRVAPDMMIQSHFLFLEWYARLEPTALVPLSGQMRDHRVVTQHCLTRADTGFSKRFRDFVKDVSRAEDLAAMASGAGDARHSFSITHTPIADDILKSCVAAIQRSESRPAEIRGKESQDASITAGKMKVALPVNRISVKAEPVSGEKLDVASQNLRKMAQEELEKMMRLAPDSYRSLKESYISSLPPETKELVLDVQRRLDSRDFDRHLRVRLVRYMIDQPSSWKSVSSAFPI